MFSNARIYNEEGSIVYQDAKQLEGLVMAKFKELYANAIVDDQLVNVDKVADFTEFDALHNLKPLAVNAALKRPIEEKLQNIDNGIDSPSAMSTSLFMNQNLLETAAVDPLLRQQEFIAE